METSWNKIFDSYDKGQDTAAFQEIVDKVSSHAKRAMTISKQLNHHKKPNQSLLDEFSLPTFAIDKSGRIFDNNAHAAPIINQTCWSHIDQMDFDKTDLEQIKKFLNVKRSPAAKNNSSAKATTSIPQISLNNSLSISKNKQMFFVDVMPQRLAAQFDSQEQPLFMLRISQIDWDESFNQELLVQFKITKAEAEILQHLVQGTHLNDIAELRGTTVRTTRTQLKTLQAKLHQPSQAKLVRWAIIMLLVHRDRNVQTAPNSFNTAPDIDASTSKTCKPAKIWDTGTRRTVTLANGAKVDLFTFGNPNGEIMLQLHALMYAPPPSDELFSIARKFGHYVIQPLRPGYGKSSPITNDADLLTEITENYRQVLDLLGISTCNLLLFGTTGSLGYQVAKNLQDRIKAIVSVSTSPPMKDASSIDALPGHAKFTMSAARYAPKLFEFLVTTARRRESNFNGWDIYFSRMIKGIVTDEKIYQRQEVKRSLYEGQRLVSSQSVKAYRQELATFMDDWLPIAQSCPQPKLIIQGTDDNTWAKQSFERFANEIDAKLVWIPGGAYLMMYSHTEQVLETIDKWMASNKVSQLGHNSRSA